MPFTQIYDAYIQWHDGAGAGDPLGKNAFGRRLGEKGYPPL